MKEIIDARGLQCPLPVINTKNKVAEMSEGDVVVTIVDNEIAVQNLTKFAENKGLVIVSEKKSDKEYHTEITVGGKSENNASKGNNTSNGTMASDANNGMGEDKNINTDADTYKDVDKANKNLDHMSAYTCVPVGNQKKKTTIVISSRFMGQGDDKLGEALMKAFTFSLTKQDVIPDTVLLYNGGAYLSTADETVEDLQYLESQGTEILTCGTCLNFYGLTDELKVGGVTNMYDIVRIMAESDLIVRP